MDKDILTGKIVGMMERNWRRYIATVPSVDMDAMERSTGRKVLVCPFDRRIPKIRVQENASFYSKTGWNFVSISNIFMSFFLVPNVYYPINNLYGNLALYIY